MTTTEPGPHRPIERAPERPAVTMPLLVLAGVLLVSLTMRAPIIAVAPAIADIRDALHIDSATAGLLTSIPVICFGLGTPLVLVLTRRTGINQAVRISLIVILAGILLRSAGGLAAALAGTLVMGLGITITNVLVPAIIGRDFPGRTTQVTGFYTAALNIGSLSATLLGAPLAGWLTWRWALATWAVVVLVAAVVWQRAVPLTAEHRSRTTKTSAPVLHDPTPLWRRRLVLGMIAAFTGQSFSYFGITAWLPTLLADERGLSAAQAGASSTFFQATALFAAFGLPWAIGRGLGPRAALLVVCACWITLPLGLALAPGLWMLWCCLGGFAQGGGFTVIFSVVVARSVSPDDARRMSAAIQGVGYILASLGPIIVGAVHTATGTWTAPMLLIAGMLVMMAVGGSVAIGGRRTGTTMAR
ncbi:MFS transporter [Kineosporia sp. J2-2]|uniref:MFS transporter n=1 Tax=Kineosporia corallincola TaxID=2835133 RepID=A0ABS5TMV4_9ACTN|nr:MFS transporter [Kineosporia corallincola]MBT0772178.1 MFS transporter [Kineosporia corallincola]